jgi:hypothetical protein
MKSRKAGKRGTGNSDRKTRTGGSRFRDEQPLPDFWDPNSRMPFLACYRSVFLDAVRLHASEVVKSLEVEVWQPAPGSDQEPVRRNLLEAWVQTTLGPKFHLTDQWVAEEAEHLLNLWSCDPSLRDDPGWLSSSSRGWHYTRFYSDEDISESLPPLKWEFMKEPWERFQARVLEGIRNQMQQYQERITAFALEKGYEKIGRKRSRDGRNPLVAFDWLVLWQVCGWTSEAIAVEFDANPDDVRLRKDAVMAQIRQAAKTIELTLRPPSRSGRPSKRSK